MGRQKAINDKLQKTLERLPTRPGVYIFKNNRGRVLYVGKSINLRARVRSYFQPGSQLTPRKELMVEEIEDMDFLVTATEAEALIVEYELITAHEPTFNVIFRDDKAYPMLKITREKFPRLIITRKRMADGARYFGPYPNAKAVKLVVRALRTLVPLRKCSSSNSFAKRKRRCLNYEMGLCCGPCIGKISFEEYGELVEQVTRLLRSDHSEITDKLRVEMDKASGRMDYERAAELRDQIFAFDRMKARQRVVGDPRRSEDIIAIARKGDRFCIQVLSIRNGRLAGQRHLFLREPEVDSEILLREFISYNYLPASTFPSRLLVSIEPADKELLISALEERFEQSTSIKIPQSGKGRRLMDMALQNARMRLDATGDEDALVATAKLLKLHCPPQRIECFDISISGSRDPVASLVVFVDGRPVPALYRRFRIKSVDGTDDFACMAEAVTRRYKRLLREGGPYPDLIIVDGGKGQISAATGALSHIDLPEEIPIFGLAKREERILGPGLGEGLVLPARNVVRRLFERIRDEAHRRAVGHHRMLRKKRSLSSALDRIPGVGPKLRKSLLTHFGDLDSIKSATLAELCAVDGVGPKLAAKIAIDLAGDMNDE